VALAGAKILPKNGVRGAESSIGSSPVIGEAQKSIDSSGWVRSCGSEQGLSPCIGSAFVAFPLALFAFPPPLSLAPACRELCGPSGPAQVGPAARSKWAELRPHRPLSAVRPPLALWPRSAVRPQLALWPLGAVGRLRLSRALLRLAAAAIASPLEGLHGPCVPPCIVWA
jgi:hypothetical protein